MYCVKALRISERICVGIWTFWKLATRVGGTGTGTGSAGSEVPLVKVVGEKVNGGEVVRWWNLASSEARKGRKSGRARK